MRRLGQLRRLLALAHAPERSHLVDPAAEGGRDRRLETLLPEEALQRVVVLVRVRVRVRLRVRVRVRARVRVRVRVTVKVSVRVGVPGRLAGSRRSLDT